MKKILIVILLVYAAASAEVMAQGGALENPPSKKELKETKKLEKAKADLAKKNEKLNKEKEKRIKMQNDFQNKNSAGKLSPNDIAKQTKAINNQVKKIEKLEKDIGKLEEYIRETEGIEFPK
ncbi:hypothetical protein [Algoriphagus confluentis]|uniref:SlyB protein n=1 Tax=Algoriphagus confluentis TaxID=1697556 RepID=A0ABQ6PRS4_9BACT|nr:hypothetical protein Aconfl_30810 [Algoriphagus confluentis]